MAFTGQQIMTSAGRILQDEDATRWTLPELCVWINEGVKAILIAKPSANSETVVLNLQAGTWQQIAADHLQLLRLVRNITNPGPPRQGGRAIRVTTRDTLDAQAPYWHDKKHTPYKKEVRQFTFDEEDPRSFYVLPGNDGTGMVEGVVSKLPAPLEASGDPDVIGSYSGEVGLIDLYEPVLVDYVVYRAMSKDDTAGNPAGAMMHYQAFALALGIKVRVSGTSSPNARPGVVGT